VNRKLLEPYESFTIPDLIKKLDGQEKQQAYGLEWLVEQILLRYNLLETDPIRRYLRRLTDEGIDMMERYEHFIFWEEDRRKRTDLPILNFTDNSIKIEGDGSKVATGSAVQDSFRDISLKAEYNKTPEIKKSKITVESILKVMAAIITLTLAILKGCNVI
jgi:hypothetical protein